MIWNLIFGVLAGYLAPMAEPRVKAALESLAQVDLPFRKDEYDLMSLLLLLMVAAILVALIGVNSMAFPLLVGAFLGLFGQRLWTSISSKRVAENPGSGRPYSADEEGKDE